MDLQLRTVTVRIPNGIDGGVRAWSDDLPGLSLICPNHEAFCRQSEWHPATFGVGRLLDISTEAIVSTSGSGPSGTSVSGIEKLLRSGAATDAVANTDIATSSRRRVHIL